MALIVWDKSYSVNVRRCDEEHQKLFSLFNDLYKAMSGTNVSGTIRDTVRQLSEYTRTHFLAEEALMQRTNYPGLAAHRIEHQKFIAQVKKFQTDVENGDEVNLIAVLGFLKDWLANHIRQTDRAYSAHLNANGVN
ncbi:MAG TPA: bacteriohemerythrin [Terriglobales bacterium]|jgi:hemerythrin